MIEQLLQPEVQEFLIQHKDSDPVELVLRYGEDSKLPIQLIAGQLRSRQKAKSKLPEWFACPRVVFPVGISLEQSSSQATGQYKASIFRGESLLDLTGGAGVDSYYLSKSFRSVDYVEIGVELAKLANHNFRQLGATNIRVHQQDSGSFLNQSNFRPSAIYLDPSRRQGLRKVRNLQDYQPKVVEMLDLLLSKADWVLIKTSPLLDIDSALQSLKSVVKVYVIAVKNECKEVLYLLSNSGDGKVEIQATNLLGDIRQEFSFNREEEKNALVDFSPPLQFLFEPNASVLKAGAFRRVGEQYGLNKLHPNTHIYTSNQPEDQFPGWVYRVEEVVPFKPKKIRSVLSLDQAIISTRNFPWTADRLRKHLKIAEGGNYYLFGTRTIDDRLILIVCTRSDRYSGPTGIRRR